MATLFFDSSLVKRYIAGTGSAWVQALNAPGAGSHRVRANVALWASLLPRSGEALRRQ